VINLIVGDYTPNKTEVVVDDFNDNLIFKNSLDSRTFIMYADMVGLTSHMITHIVKKATRNIKIVLSSKKLITHIRNSKKVKITEQYDNKEESPFTVAKYVMGLTDRNYLFEYLKNTMPQRFMLVKVLISNFKSFTKANQQWIAYIDKLTWKCHPEIIFAIMAFKIKVEPKFKDKYTYMQWNFPKSKKKQ